MPQGKIELVTGGTDHMIQHWCHRPLYHCGLVYLPKLVLYIPIWALLISHHYIMIYTPPGPIFRCESNGEVYFGIGLTISLFYMYMPFYTVFQCKFSGNDHYVIWRLYCHKQYMIWASSGTIFQHEFNSNSHYVTMSSRGQIVSI